MNTLSGEKVSQAIGILEQTPKTLRTILANAVREELQWRPKAERWSIAMVLAHLADVERRGFRARFESMLREKDAFLPAYDQHLLLQADAAFDGSSELGAFERERAETLRLLDDLPAEALERTGRHEELGQITVGQLLAEFAFHDMGHIRQILELYRSHAFYPFMGGFQGYYQVHP